MKVDKKKIKVPKALVDDWQSMVSRMAKELKICAALIMRIDQPNIEVFCSSESSGNPYKVGDSYALIDSGLYCEDVYTTKQKLMISNALKSKKWRESPAARAGLIAYMGFPILWADGEVFGTICLLDGKENAYSDAIEHLLLQAATYIECCLDLLISKYFDKNKKEITENSAICDKELDKFNILLKMVSGS